jgi:hypothetical protein
MPANSGTEPIDQFFGIKGIDALYSTGYPGSPSTGALESPPLMAVSIVPVYESSQGELDRVTVDVGDTFSSSSDTVVVTSPLLPGAPYAAKTGLGEGHVQ